MNLVIALLALIIVAAIVAVGVWAMMNLAASSLDVNDFGETDVSAWAPPTAEELDELARDACPHCRGSGLRDSGGVHPWDDPILIPCDCPAARTAVSSIHQPAVSGINLPSRSAALDHALRDYDKNH